MLKLYELKEYAFLSFIYAIYQSIKSWYKNYFVVLNRTRYRYIGKGVIIKTPSYFDPSNIEVEDAVSIGSGFRLISNKGCLKIKRYCVFASDCTIITQNHIPTVSVPLPVLTISHINDDEKDVIIEEEVWIGYGATILKGAKLNRGIVVAAGSIVNKEIPPYAVCAGSPAKIKGVRFSLEQILKHEESLYPQNMRIPKVQLEELFNTTYKDLKILGTSTITLDDQLLLNRYKEKLHL